MNEMNKYFKEANRWFKQALEDSNRAKILFDFIY